MRMLRLFTAMALVVGPAAVAAAQDPSPASRTAAIEQEQAEKAKALHPYELTKTERVLNKVGDILAGPNLHWHPFFEGAYSGSGFLLGVGYLQPVSAYNLLDVRGSYSIRGYKRAEVEFKAPRLFKRRGELTLLGGWREATQAAFYGLGMDTSKGDRTNYDFKQPYGSATVEVWPMRRLWMLRGGVEVSQWKLGSGQGASPSVDEKYTPTTLPGVGATINYVHSQGTVALDWRTSPGYSRRGGYYGVTGHDYTDTDKGFGFQQVDYEAIQHVPFVREAWVISLRALAKTTADKGDQQIPFFLLPTLGGGSTLRAFSSHRFRDRNSLLVQAEWRIMVNRFFDTAVFYDAGKVTARTSDLDLKRLKHDYGFGVRLHGPFATPLRIDLGHSNETGLAVVFATSSAF